MISAAMDFWMITFRNFEGPSASCGESQFCSKNTPVGIDVPTTARGWNLAYGLFSVGETEGVQGGTEGNISPVGCPPKAEMTRSSGKQQAERTAVRAAPIVCPEESPLPASVYDNYAVRRFAAGGLAHRLRRGSLANFSVQRCPKCERKALWCARRRIPLAPGGV